MCDGRTEDLGDDLALVVSRYGGDISRVQVRDIGGTVALHRIIERAGNHLLLLQPPIDH